jgi:hypothetical protein
MTDSPKREPRARPAFWAPFGWAAILTLILAGAIFFRHSLPSHVSDFLASILLLPAALVFVLLRVPGDFLTWLSGVPDWLLFVLMTVDAYFYSLVLTMLIWIIMRFANARRKAGRVTQ